MATRKTPRTLAFEQELAAVNAQLTAALADLAATAERERELTTVVDRVRQVAVQMAAENSIRSHRWADKLMRVLNKPV